MFGACFRSIADIHSCLQECLQERREAWLSVIDGMQRCSLWIFFSHSFSFFVWKTLSVSLSFLNIAGHVEANSGGAPTAVAGGPNGKGRADVDVFAVRPFRMLATINFQCFHVSMFPCFLAFIHARKFVECFIFLTPRSVHMSTTASPQCPA